MSAQRFETSEAVNLQLVGDQADIHAEMKNISQSGGLFVVFSGNYIPQKGDLIEIKSESREMVAEVVWTDQGKVGACFFHPRELEERLMSRTSFGRAS
jgi:hypothetical protein